MRPGLARIVARMRAGILALSLLFLISCGSDENKLDRLKSDGQKMFLNNEYKLARDYFIKGLAIKPSDRDLLYFTGLCCKRDFLYDSALVYLKRADLLHPNDREVNLELYSVALATKSWQEAVDAIMVLVETWDPLDNYLDQLTILNVRLEQPLSVVYFLRRLIQIRPDSAIYPLQLANALIVVESLDAAAQVVDSAVARFGPFNELVATRATIGAYQGNYVQAEKTFRDLLVKDTAQSNRYKLNLASALSMQKDKAKKREALQLYKEIRPTVDAAYRIDSLIDTLEKELR